MDTDEFRANGPNAAYIGKGVTVKGEIEVPEVLVVEGTVEGSVEARSLRIGAEGVVKGHVAVDDAEVHGKLADEVEIKELLHVRATGRIEGNVSCGDVQVEKGAVIAGGVFSTHPQASEGLAAPAAAPSPEPAQTSPSVPPISPNKAPLFSNGGDGTASIDAAE